MRNTRRRRLPFGAMASLAFVGSSAVAQAPDQHEPVQPVDVPRSELVARRDGGKPFWETKWIVRDDGTLTQLPNPAAPTPRGLSFVGDEDPASISRDPLAQLLCQRIRTLSALATWVAPLLRQPGDLLGATAANRHFAQLGREATDVALRQFVVQPTALTEPHLDRRELLDRELAVRVLQARGVRGAVGELRAVAKTATDPWLQRTAQEALASLLGEAAPARVPLRSLPIDVPDGIELWLWIDAAHLPPRADIPMAVHRASADELWQHLLGNRRNVVDIALAGAQFRVDLPDELPFEAARAWGRVRVDQCLLGLRCRGGVQLVWAAASGAYEVDVLAAHLERKVGVVRQADSVTATDWWPGFTVEVGRDRVVVRSKTLGDAIAREWPPVVADAIATRAGVAAELTAEAGAAALPWLLLAGEGTAVVHLAPFALRVTTKAAKADAQARCRAAAEDLGRLARKSDRASAAAVDAWKAALLGATAQPIEGSDRVRIEVAGKDLDPLLLWPLLR